MVNRLSLRRVRVSRQSEYGPVICTEILKVFRLPHFGLFCFFRRSEANNRRRKRVLVGHGTCVVVESREKTAIFSPHFVNTCICFLLTC